MTHQFSPIEVTLLDVMGNDLTVVNAARVSFAKTKHTFDEKDARLLRYLLKHKHWSPLAHAHLSFRVQAPFYVRSQLIRHTAGIAWNEKSYRYVSDSPTFHYQSLRMKPEGSIKQGSSNETLQKDEELNTNVVVCNYALMIYNDLIRKGVAPECARAFLPQSTMTEWIWTMSLAAALRIISLRLSGDSQQESALVVRHIRDAIITHFPHTWAAAQSVPNGGQ